MKPNLIMLHGALGSSVQLEPLAGILKDDFSVILYNFTGHGGKPVPEEPFSIRLFALELKTLIERTRSGPCNIFGYSMGGYAALFAAKNFPGIAEKVFTLGTKFDWNEESSAREAGMLDPVRLEEKIPAFANALKERHAPEDWKNIVSKTAQMMISLGKRSELTFEELGEIENEVTVAVGDRDNMVNISETEKAYRSLKNGRMIVLPDTYHPVEKVSIDRLVYEIRNFFR